MLAQDSLAYCSSYDEKADNSEELLLSMLRERRRGWGGEQKGIDLEKKQAPQNFFLRNYSNLIKGSRETRQRQHGLFMSLALSFYIQLVTFPCTTGLRVLIQSLKPLAHPFVVMLPADASPGVQQTLSRDGATIYFVS